MQRFLVFLLVVLPLAAATFVPAASEGLDYLQASRQAEQAQVSGDREAETAALEIILAYQPWRFEKWEQLADLDYATGDYQKAIDHFEHCLCAGYIICAEFF